MPRIRKHLTYANVSASLALFLVVSGGAAYAATHPARNSVGTRQLRNNAVTSAKVKNGSLLARDFAAGQLPVGAQGAQGERGPQGPRGDAGAAGSPGISGYVQEDGFSAFDSTSPKSAEAECPPGTTAIGGGVFVNGVVSETVAIQSEGPESGDAAKAHRWFADAFEAVPTANQWNIDVRVICAKVAP